MNIAFIQFGDYHLEVSGVFLHYFKIHCQSNIDLYYTNDSSNYINTSDFSNIFKLNRQNLYEQLFLINTNQQKYDYIIFLSFNEYDNLKHLFQIEHYKLILVVHIPLTRIQEDTYKNIKTIALSPLVDKLYLLPVYNSFIHDIAMIGYFDKKDFNDIENFLKRFPDKKLFVFTKLQNIEYFKSCKNFIIMYNKPITFIKEFIKNNNISHLWLCPGDDSFHVKDRLSGIIPLSINICTPLILPKRMTTIYKEIINVLEYKNTIIELIQKDNFVLNKNKLLLDCLFCKTNLNLKLLNKLIVISNINYNYLPTNIKNTIETSTKNIFIKNFNNSFFNLDFNKILNNNILLYVIENQLTINDKNVILLNTLNNVIYVNTLNENDVLIINNLNDHY